MTHRMITILGMLAAAFTFAAPAGAQIIWDGGGADDNWTTGANWIGDVAPVPANAGVIEFQGNLRLTPNADVAFVLISNLNFQAGSGAFTINGQQLSIDGPTNTTGFITNDSTTTQTINNDILVTGGIMVFDAFVGDLIINSNIDTNGFGIQLQRGNAAVAQTTTANGVISGTGGLFAPINGTTIFTGINTFTGDVDIQDGLVRLDGDFANTVLVNVDGPGIFELGGNETIGSLTGDGSVVLNANELIVGDATNFAFTGVISGVGGSLTKQGTGTFTVGGVNTYTGPTTINNGTLLLNGDLPDTNDVIVNTPGTFALGGDETIRSLAGDGNVNLNAFTLTVGNGVNTDFSGVMSGTGGLTKQGPSMFTLSGNNTFTGLTNVNGGILDLTGTSTSSVMINSARFDLNGTLTGDVTNQGGGTYNLIGMQTGNITNTAGTVNLNGNVTGNVTNNSALTGNGTIGGTLTNNTGSTTTPGTNGTIDTLNITTNLIQNANSNLNVDVNKDGGNTITNDVLAVGGAATLAANSRINVTDLNGGGVFAPGDTIPLITTGGGVTDNGVRVFFPNGVVVFIPQITGTTFELLAVQPGDLALGASGANNINLATAIDFDTPLAAGDYQTFINALDALGGGAPLDAALQDASPLRYAAITDTNLRSLQHHASINSNYLDNRRLGIVSPTQLTSNGNVPATMQFASAADNPALLASVLNAQIAAEGAPGEWTLGGREYDDDYHFYGTAFGLFTDQDNKVDAPGYNANIFGGQIGLDEWVTDDVLLGLLFGFDFANIDFDGGGSADTQSLRVGPYIDWSDNTPGGSPWYVNGSVTYGFHMNDVDRSIAFAGFAGTPTSDFNAHDVSVYLGTGFDIDIPKYVITVTPFASMQYTFYSTGSFTESNGGGAELSVDGRDVHSFRTLLGARVRAVHQTGNLTFGSEGFLGWSHEFLNDEEFTGVFANGTGFNQFSVTPDQTSEDSLYFGAGLSTLLNDNTSAHIRYEGDISADGHVHAIRFGVSFSF